MKIEKLIKKHDIRTNSKDIKKGDIFFCTLGNIDKNEFIPDAIKKKCSLVVSDKKINIKKKKIVCNNINNYLKRMLDLKYHYPLNNKRIIGITGTDGKTTCASIIKDMLNGAYIGTNGLIIDNLHFDTNNTTPSLDFLYRYFDLINKKNVSNIVMEVSSEAYLTKRIPNLHFDVGIFLNISSEHLDKHKTFDNYLKCKLELLNNSTMKVINRDDKYFKLITKNIDNYLTFGKRRSDLQIVKYKLFFNKTVIDFKYQKKIFRVVSPLLGEYNVYNLAAAITCLLILNYDINDIIKRISYIKSIPGRMERIVINDKLIIIDYAHTINATNEVLKYVKKYSKRKIITIVGCAGDRYKEKRSIIGKIVLKYSDKVFFTMDDPRWEDANDIIKEMIGKSKKKNYEIIINREDAIKKALDITNNKYLVLILGKGRDNYLIVKDKKIKYSDISVINDYKNMLNNVKKS